jgi:hypothetical protein
VRARGSSEAWYADSTAFLTTYLAPNLETFNHWEHGEH